MSNEYAIILLGSPGSGKTSIAHRLASNERIEFIETGHLLREEVESKSDLGEKLKSHLQSGELAPTELVVQVVNQKLRVINEKVIVFDGSPRREEEIEPFSEMLVHNDISLLKVIIFKLNREDAFKRLTGRRICPNCGKIYNIYYNPPPEENACEGCDGELEQREDDKPEVVNKRIDEFEEHTVPVIQYFKEKYLAKAMEIDAQKPIDQILEIIWSQINEYLNVHKV